MTQSKSEISLHDETSVEVRRSFSAPRELVYQAYTVPELFRRWCLGPPGWSLPVCEMDVRVGGSYRWRWRADEGDLEFGFFGEFLEVDPPARLVHTQTYDPGTIGNAMAECTITVELSEAAGVTSVVTRIVYGSREERDLSLSTGMAEGMELSYQNLDALAAERAALGASD